MKRWFYVGLGVFVVLLIGYAALAWYRGEVVDVVVARAERGTVRAYVDERGVTRLDERYDITMPYDGRIELIELDIGDRVSAGQIVARIVPADVKLDVAAAEAAVHELEASLAENADVALEMTAKQQTELMAQAFKAMAEAATFQQAATGAWLEYWEWYAARILPLTRASAESEDELQRATAQREASAAELEQRERNAESQSLMYQAMQLVPQMIVDYLHRKDLQGQVIARQLEEAKVLLAEAQLRKKRSEMTSPVDGVVLDRPVFYEQFQRAGTVLLTIGRLQDLEVEADILTQEAAGIAVDDPVEVYGPAIGAALGQGVRGSVRRISPDAFTKVSSLGVEEQRATVVVRLNDPIQLLETRPGLGVGFRVRVRVFTQEQANVVAVPRPALFRGNNGQWNLFVVRGGRAAAQPVDIGLMNDDIAEVTSGLQEGETVILAPESNLVEGVRVRASEQE